MSVEGRRRDYRLIGLDAKLAQENGLAAAEWYACPIPRTQLRALMKRTDGPAIRDTLIWLAALTLSGLGGWWFWGTAGCAPFFLVYGVLYGSASDSRMHECNHGTAFKTRWMNDAVYHAACFMMLREPTVWRWSHTRHHTDTIIVGRDPEIAAQRPPDVLGHLLNLFALKNTAKTLRCLVPHVAGRLTVEEETFIPGREHWKVYAVARLYLAILAAIALWCIAVDSILPAMFVGLPTLYGGFLALFFGLTQHAGLAEDVLDHRLNTRTVLMNPVLRFLYWNMNYHMEHHMFPMVPYHTLPKLHEAIKADCPAPYPSCWAAYREIIPALLRQIKAPSHHVHRKLPSRSKAAPPTHGTPIIVAE